MGMWIDAPADNEVLHTSICQYIAGRVIVYAVRTVSVARERHCHCHHHHHHHRHHWRHRHTSYSVAESDTQTLETALLHSTCL